MTDLKHANENAKAWFVSIQEMNKAHKDACMGDDTAKIDETETAIRDSVLSVMVRDGWHSPGQPSEDGPEEYEILLSTGGPACRIFGLLDKHGTPETAEMQVQDWGTHWTYYPTPQAPLVDFASHFYFEG